MTTDAPVRDTGRWLVRWKVDKYAEDIEPYRGREHEFHATHTPYEVVEGEGNLLLNEGINNLWNILCGNGSTTLYNNANARIGVGDSTTAAAATQTDLQAATNKLYKGMDATFPTSGTLQKATFKASYATGEANFAWQEWTVDNGATAALNLNRKVENLGTKASGTWSLTVELSLA